MKIKGNFFQLKSKIPFSIIMEALKELLENRFNWDESDGINEYKDFFQNLNLLGKMYMNNRIDIIFGEEDYNNEEKIQIIFRIIRNDEKMTKDLDKYFDY